MNYIFYLRLLGVLINFSFIQNEEYCDIKKKCEDCIECGTNIKNICSCSLNNLYCKNSEINDITVLSTFLYSYDGCISNNGNLENICGNSNIDIDIGTNTSKNIKSSADLNYFCFYNVKKIKNNNNDIKIILKKEVNEPIFFYLHMIIYYNYDYIKITSIQNPLSNSNFLEIVESEAEKISVYIYIPQKNIDKAFFFFGIENGTIKKVTYKDKLKTNVKIIYGVLGGFCGILLIILIICIIRHKKMKKNNIVSNTSVIKKASEISSHNINKEKMNNLFKTELVPKIYDKTKASNDCQNCTICLEDFKDGLSKIVTTNCKHSFHFECFKNWVFKNINSPRCPNCNNPILDIKNNNNPTSTSIINTENLQTLQNNTEINSTTF